MNFEWIEDEQEFVPTFEPEVCFICNKKQAGNEEGWKIIKLTNQLPDVLVGCCKECHAAGTK